MSQSIYNDRYVARWHAEISATNQPLVRDFDTLKLGQGNDRGGAGCLRGAAEDEDLHLERDELFEFGMPGTDDAGRDADGASDR